MLKRIQVCWVPANVTSWHSALQVWCNSLSCSLQWLPQWSFQRVLLAPWTVGHALCSWLEACESLWPLCGCGLLSACVWPCASCANLPTWHSVLTQLLQMSSLLFLHYCSTELVCGDLSYNSVVCGWYPFLCTRLSTCDGCVLWSVSSKMAWLVSLLMLGAIPLPFAAFINRITAVLQLANSPEASQRRGAPERTLEPGGAVEVQLLTSEKLQKEAVDKVGIKGGLWQLMSALINTLLSSTLYDSFSLSCGYQHVYWQCIPHIATPYIAQGTSHYRLKGCG